MLLIDLLACVGTGVGLVVVEEDVPREAVELFEKLACLTLGQIIVPRD